MNGRSDYLILSFLPVLLLFAFFFLGPIGFSLYYSFCDRKSRWIGIENYVNLFQNEEFYSALQYTFKIAIISVAIAIVFAVLFSMVLRGTFIGRRVCLFFYQFNVSMPHLIVATMMILLLLPVGYLPSILYNMGLISDVSNLPLMIMDKKGVGVIICYVWKFIPFIGLSVLSTLQSTSTAYEEQCRCIGMGKITTFLHVTLPSIKTAILSTGLIAFAFAFGSYEVPALVGKTKTLAELAYYDYNNYYSMGGQPEAYAINVIILLVIMAVSILYLRIAVPKGGKRVE